LRPGIDGAVLTGVGVDFDRWWMSRGMLHSCCASCDVSIGREKEPEEERTSI
jgi:hypothetical protein